MISGGVKMIFCLPFEQFSPPWVRLPLLPTPASQFHALPFNIITVVFISITAVFNLIIVVFNLITEVFNLIKVIFDLITAAFN